jgi:glucokinase
MMRILSGEIGGQSSELALFEGERPEQLRLTRRQRFENSAFSGAVGMVGEFMHGVRVDAAAFGLDGSVHGGALGMAHSREMGRVDAVSLPWDVELSPLSSVLGTEHCALFNDVQVATLGVADAADGSTLWFQRCPLDPAAPKAVVRVGSSYGLALCLPSGDSLATEVGQTCFPPRNAIERRLLNHLAERFEPVCLEHVLSWTGLRRLYDFLVFEGLAPATALAEIERAADPSHELARLGSRDLDRACAAAVGFLTDLLGAELARVGLAYLPRQGLYLTGDLARSLRSVFEEGPLLEAFLERSETSSLLAEIPLALIDEPDLILLGAKRAALQLLERRAA